MRARVSFVLTRIAMCVVLAVPCLPFAAGAARAAASVGAHAAAFVPGTRPVASLASEVPFTTGSGEPPLAAYLEELDDYDGRYTVDDVRSVPLAHAFRRSASLEPDIRYRARWYRFALDPRFAAGDDWRLTISRKIDDADLYVPGPGGYRVVRFGMGVPVAARPVRSGYPSLGVTPALTGATLYLRTVGPGTDILELGRARAIDAANAPSELLSGLQLGIFLTLVLAALLYAALIRQLIYVLYAALSFAALVNQLVDEPLAWQYLWPALSLNYFILLDITYAVYLALFGIFMRTYLMTRAYVAWLDRPLVAVTIFSVGYVALRPFLAGQYGFDPRFVSVSDFALLIVGAIAALVRVRQGFAPARAYAAGLAVVIVSFILADYRLTGHASDYATALGQTSDMLAFLFALAYQTRLANVERLEALIATETANEALLDQQRSHIGAVEARNSSFRRFMPREFLQHLDRTDIVDVSLGDHAEREMNVLFTDIRGFATLAETMSPQQTFDFLNGYLGRVGPLIRAHDGFIDKYIGDAIMALFPNAASDGIDAAIAMQAEVRRFNEYRARQGTLPISIGIGIHRGALMLGTVGETERLDTTVISDVVNVASRFEGLTKIYGADIVVSGAIVDALRDRTRYRLRPLGDIAVKGTSRPIAAFEVCDTDAPELLIHKIATLETFERALARFRAGAFAESGPVFAELARSEPRDRVALYFRDQSALRDATSIAWEGADRRWDGTDRLEVK